ncbi:3-deoxy-D-arabino-heptulosonate 7-phosphate synthase [Bacillus cereus ATCC 10987]|uniref:3-deoxy-D-arabino-heptulosonate 7-phosphate synthase n=1 Tax=Bacillus cereus (strain ATCC 10987 / NRS 248) TaxID=222523 RepID=Q72Z54_BACC1|nr:3-deoxy-D-arabino-heptulosonate 7-phosphate synthase [Bacillus cereus ATCC 10987]
MFKLSFFTVNERGRWDGATRNMLHISAVLISKKETYLPLALSM